MAKPFGPWSDGFDTRNLTLTVQNRGYFGGSAGAWSIASNISNQGLGTRRTRTGYVSPNKPYIVPRNASLVLQRKHQIEPLAAKWYYAGLDHTLECKSGQINTDWVNTSVIDGAKYDNLARMAFQKKARQGLQLYPILAEARKTARGIASNAEGLASGLTKAFQPTKKRVFRRKMNASSYMKFASDRWLEWVYQYKPTINDISAGLVALDDLTTNSNYFTPAKASGSGKYDRLTSYWWYHLCISSIYGGSGQGYVCATSGNLYTTYETTMGASWAPTPGVGTYKTLGTQWQDVLPAVWELIPYSFVVDYFSNLQEVIQGHSFDFTVWTNYWAMNITKHEGVLTSSPRAPNANYVQKGGTPALTNINYFTFNRGPATLDSFRPKLELSLPTLAQSANLIALAASRVSKISRVFTL